MNCKCVNFFFNGEVQRAHDGLVHSPVEAVVVFVTVGSVTVGPPEIFKVRMFLCHLRSIDLFITLLFEHFQIWTWNGVSRARGQFICLIVWHFESQWLHSFCVVRVVADQSRHRGFPNLVAENISNRAGNESPERFHNHGEGPMGLPHDLGILEDLHLKLYSREHLKHIHWLSDLTSLSSSRLNATFLLDAILKS